ncbi:MAG: hypothetical protein GVY04_19405 [Cyanobacteria bacterium]|nr:hypothetical protein [Cyanobacteria bacterium GSL.Bin1]
MFSQSEGEQEGKLIGNLAKELIATTNSRDLYGFVAVDGEQMIGAIFFSRLTFACHGEAPRSTRSGGRRDEEW